MTLALMIVLILLTYLYICLYLYKQARVDLFRPSVFVGFLFTWFYVLDIMYVIFDSKENNSFPLSGYYFVYEENSIIIVSFIILASFVAWLLGDMVVGKYFSKYNNSENKLMNDKNISFRLVRTIGFLTFLFLLITLLLLLNFISSVGGLSWYMDHIADRALIFKDATYLYSFIQMAMILGSIVCAFLFVALNKGKKLSFVVLLFSILILSLVISLGLLSGARANILKSLVIMVCIWNYLAKKLRFNFKLVLSLILLCVGFVTYADLTRNNFDTDNSSIIDHVFNSVEVSQANNLLILDQMGLDGDAGGKTIISGFLSFIPSSVFEMFGSQKSYGGNAYFTEAVWPDRWYRTHSEVALGLIGDLTLNVGFFMTPIIIFILGALYRVAYELFVRHSVFNIWGMILYIGVVWSLFQLIRGDLFNTINNFVVFVASCMISFAVVRLMYKNNKGVRKTYKFRLV